jgi:protein-tyrosine phosphatase
MSLQYLARVVLGIRHRMSMRTRFQTGLSSSVAKILTESFFTTKQLACYDNLLLAYQAAFGEQAVCHAPVLDYDPVPTELMQDTIRPFLSEADARGEQAVVHCSAGQGRTGQVLALWLAIERGYSVDDAIRTVSAQGRAPLESPLVTPESLRRAVKQISEQSD